MGLYTHLTQLTPPPTLEPIIQTGFGHRPKLVLAFWSGRGETENAAGRADIRRGFGVVTEDRRLLVAFNIITDGDASSNNGGSVTASTNPESFEAGLILPASFDADGITWNFLALPTSPETIRFSELSLSDRVVAEVAVASIVEPAAPGDVDATLGFQPDAALVFGAQRLPDNSDASKSAMSSGVAAGSPGSVEQGHVSMFSRGVGQTSDSKTYGLRGYVYSTLDETTNDAAVDRASVDFTSTGARLSFDAASGDQKQILVVGIRLADGARARVFSGEVGENPIPAPGDLARGGIFLTTNQDESSGLAAARDDTGCFGGFEVLDGGAINQIAHSWFNGDAENPQASGSSIDYDAVLGHMVDETEQNGKLGVLDQRPGEVEVGFVGEPYESGDFFTCLLFGSDAPTPVPERVAAVAIDPSAAPVARFTREPESRLDYWLDWTAMLTQEDGSTDPIVASSWSAPAGLTIAEDTYVGLRAMVLIEGGSVGASYRVENTIRTLAGRARSREIEIRVRNL